MSGLVDRRCRVHNAPVAYITHNASVSIVGNHPLALVRYNCNHQEFVREDKVKA